MASTILHKRLVVFSIKVSLYSTLRRCVCESSEDDDHNVGLIGIVDSDVHVIDLRSRDDEDDIGIPPYR